MGERGVKLNSIAKFVFVSMIFVIDCSLETMVMSMCSLDEEKSIFYFENFQKSKRTNNKNLIDSFYKSLRPSATSL